MAITVGVGVTSYYDKWIDSEPSWDGTYCYITLKSAEVYCWFGEDDKDNGARAITGWEAVENSDLDTKKAYPNGYKLNIPENHRGYTSVFLSTDKSSLLAIEIDGSDINKTVYNRYVELNGTTWKCVLGDPGGDTDTFTFVFEAAGYTYTRKIGTAAEETYSGTYTVSGRTINGTQTAPAPATWTATFDENTLIYNFSTYTKQ
jgi:hypothetical protein